MEHIKTLIKESTKMCQLLFVVWMLLIVVYTSYTIKSYGENILSFKYIFFLLSCTTVFLNPAILLTENRIAKKQNRSGSYKDYTMALRLAMFLGLFGVHRFYCGRFFSGMLCLLTLNGCLIGWAIDILFILMEKFTDSTGHLVSESLKSKETSYPSNTPNVATESTPPTNPSTMQHDSSKRQSTKKEHVEDLSKNDVKSLVSSALLNESDADSYEESVLYKRALWKGIKTELVYLETNGNPNIVHLEPSSNARRDRFYEAMKWYEDVNGPSSLFTPFKAYLPTYFDMTTNQLAYYFYWRSKIRSGTTSLKTSLSYVLVYTYELLSGIGWKEPEEGYEKLMLFWASQRKDFPEIDGFLSEWSFDFAQLHQIDFCYPDFLDIPNRSNRHLYNAVLKNLSEQKPLKLNASQISNLSSYEITHSSFYNSYKYSSVKYMLPEVLTYVDTHFWETTGSGFLRTYGPQSESHYTYKVFKGTVCPNRNQNITLTQYPYSDSINWQQAFTQIVKYTENKMREVAHFRGNVHTSKEYPELYEIIDQYFENKVYESKDKFSIDAANNQVRLESPPIKESKASYHAKKSQCSESMRTPSHPVDHGLTIKKKSLEKTFWNALNIKRELSEIEKPGHDELHLSSNSDERRNRFYTAMKRCENIEGDPVPFVPFEKKLPTYFDMDATELAYYFYWRSKVRKGSFYRNTSMGYILVYVYELLSGIGWKEPKEGYEKLMLFWKNLRNQFPKLDECLAPWIFDFSELYLVPFLYPDFLGIPPYSQTAFYNNVLTKLSDQKPLTLEFRQILKLCYSYDITKNRFYVSKYTTAIEKELPEILAYVDLYFWERRNKGILRVYGPTAQSRVEYRLFADTMSINRGRTIPITQYQYATSDGWQKALKQIIKYSENKMRASVDFRSRVKTSPDFPELDRIIDRYFEQKSIVFNSKTAVNDGAKNSSLTPSPRKSITKSSRNSLTPISSQETSERRRRKEVPPLTFNDDKINDIRRQSKAVRSALEVKEDAPLLKFDDNEMQEFIEKLSENHYHFLEMMKSQNWNTIAEPAVLSMAKEINQVSEEILASTCIIPKENRIYVAPEWREQLEQYIKEPAKERTSQTNDQTHTPSTLLELLSDAQRRAVVVILSGKKVNEQLERLADEEFSFPEAFIDEINDIALSTINTALIDTTGEIPTIYEEHKDKLKGMKKNGK